MKLRYETTWSRRIGSTVVLTKGEQRIELYIKRRNEHTWTLVALSGSANSIPEKLKLQGPYHSIDQAHAALSAILNVLKHKGLELDAISLPIWSLQAQAAVNEQRKAVGNMEGAFVFNPEDVYFDTLGSNKEE